MHGVGAGRARGVDQLVDAEVALGRRARPDVDGLIGVAHVPRAAIAVGIHGDRRDPELAAGADDAHGDLAAVGDEDFHAVNCSLRVICRAGQD